MCVSRQLATPTMVSDTNMGGMLASVPVPVDYNKELELEVMRISRLIRGSVLAGSVGQESTSYTRCWFPPVVGKGGTQFLVVLKDKCCPTFSNTVMLYGRECGSKGFQNRSSMF